MKKAFITLSLLSCGLMCADAAANYMTVELKGAKKFSFKLSDKPVVTYENGDLVVNGNASTSYAISGVKNFHFTEGDETAVENTNADMLRIVSSEDNTISVENAPTGAKVVLVNAGGATVATTTADQIGAATISLPSTKGVYVLMVGKQSIKLIRK
ncbi:MAG: hypothetical protein MJZ42_05500 [Bacteroidales bacterium]|nr:hypothetical protein [Bacteroidales bacterium]